MMRIAQNFGTVIGVSATMPPSLPFFKVGATLTPLLKITAPMPHKPFFSTVVTDYTSLIIDALKQYQRVVIHLNDKGMCGAIKEELKRSRITAELFNSSTKKEGYHKEMIACGKLPDCRVLLVTSLFDDGYSFFDGDSYALILTATSKLSPFQIEQISARLRNNPPQATILARLNFVEEEETKTFDYTRFLNRTKKILAAKCESYNSMLAKLIKIYESESESDSSLVNLDLTRLTHDQVVGDSALSGLVWDGEKWAVDIISIHQSAFRAWQAFCNKNLDRMIEELKQYGFVYMGEWQAEIKKEEAKARKKRICNYMKIYKTEKQAKIAASVESIETLTDAERFGENFNNCSKGQPHKYMAAKFILRLYEAGLTFENAKAVLLDGRSLSSNQVTKVESVIRFKKMKRAAQRGESPITPEAKFYYHLLTRFKVGDILTKEVIAEAMTEAALAADNAAIVLDTYFPDDEKSRQYVQTYLINRMYTLKRIKQPKEKCSSVAEFSVLYKPKPKNSATKYEKKVLKLEKEEKELGKSEKKPKKKRKDVYKVLEDPDTFVLRPTRKKEPAKNDAPTQPVVKETKKEQVGQLEMKMPASPPSPPSPPPPPPAPTPSIQEYLDRGDFKQAKVLARRIKDAHERGKWLRRISATKREAQNRKKQK